MPPRRPPPSLTEGFPRPIEGHACQPFGQVWTNTPRWRSTAPSTARSMEQRSVGKRREEGGQIGRGGCSPSDPQGSATAHGHHVTPAKSRPPPPLPPTRP